MKARGASAGAPDAGTGREPLGEARPAYFTELSKTAIVNAESRAHLYQLASEQAALRRVATLVAGEAPPKEVFSTVLAEIGQLFSFDVTTMCRYETDGSAALVAYWVCDGKTLPIPVGTRWPLGGRNCVTLVHETGCPIRIDDYDESASGVMGEVSREVGARSMAGTPIMAEGRLWGYIGGGYLGAATTIGKQLLPPDCETRLASFSELVAMAIANAETRAELTASRARIVAAADESRRRIERDLHDGTQQELVSVVLDMRRVESELPQDLIELKTDLSHIAERVAGVRDQVQEVSRGIHPAMLSKGGLQVALKALARRSAVPVELDVRTGQRLPDSIEIAAYYAVSEALANAVKHAHASVVHVLLDTPDSVVRLEIHDDGIGGADPAKGSGLTGLRDRVEALGGTLDVNGSVGGGTTLLIEMPV